MREPREKYSHAGKYGRGELTARPHLSVYQQCFPSHRRNEASFGGYAFTLLHKLPSREGTATVFYQNCCSPYVGRHVEAILEPNPGFPREALDESVLRPGLSEGKRLFYMGSNAVFGRRLSEWAFALIGRSHMCRFDGEALWHAGSPKHTGRRAFPKYLNKQFTETESKILHVYIYQCVTS